MGKQNDNDRITKQRKATQERIATELGQTGFALPGTVLIRTMTCGKKTCRCHSDPSRLHGPYIQWTRKVDRKTVTRNLTDQQWEDYQEWFDNAKRLRALIAELETVSMEIFETDLT